jgi:hypothetical protein
MTGNEARGEGGDAPPGSREAVRHDYVHGDFSIARIAAKHGISDTTVGAWAKAGAWTRLVGTKPLKTGRKPRPRGAPLPRRPTIEEIRRRRIVRRMFNVLDAKLTELETRMQNATGDDAPQSAADLERHARSLTAYAGLYAKLVELDEAAKQAGRDLQGAAGNEDADQFRLDLARRLERLVRASRNV